MTRLGLLGGTFDPVHVGHLDAAAAARSALALDGVLFVPAHDPPHRQVDPRATAFHRFALLALAVDGVEGYRLSDLELRRSGPSYTATTLRALHAEGWSPAQLFFIIGADAFAEIATWYDYPSVLDCANFVVVARPGAPTVPTTPARPARPDQPGIHLVEAPTRDVSSTAIRVRLAAGHAISDLVPAPVARYIAAHGLYGSEHRDFAP